MNHSVIRDLFKFLKSPKNEQADITTGQKVWKTVQVWAFQALLMFIAGIIVGYILSATNWQGENLVETSAQESILLFFFLAVILAPVIEELAFRGWLNPSRKILAVSVTFFTFFAIPTLASFLPQTQTLEDVLFFALIPSSILAGLFTYVLTHTKESQEKIKEFNHKNFSKLFYFSSITFGLVHIGNYTGLKDIWFVLPLLALPQIVGGLTLGYVRVKFGLILAMFSHLLTNLFPFLALFAITSMSQSAQDMIQSGEDTVENLTSSDSILIVALGLGFMVYAGIVIGINIYNLIQLRKK